MTRLNASSRLNSLALLAAGCGILVLLLLSLPAQGQFGDFIPTFKKNVHRKELEVGVKKYQSGQYEEADGIFKKLQDAYQVLPEDVKKDLGIWTARNKSALKRRAEGHEQLQRVKQLLSPSINKPLEALPILKELITNQYLTEPDRRERDELWNRHNNVPAGNYKKLMSDAHKAFDCKDYISALALAREAQKVLPWIHNPLDTPAQLISRCEAALQHEQQNPAPIPLPIGPPSSPPPQPLPLPVGPPQAPPFPPPPEKKDSSFSPMKGVKDLFFPSKDAPKEPGKDGPQIKDAPKPPTTGAPDGPPLPLPEPPPMTPMKTSDNRGPAPFTPRMSAQDLPPASPEPPAPGLVTAGGAGNSDGGIVPVTGFALPGLGDKNSPEETNRKRAVAQQLLKEGYNALSINDFDAARRFAHQAQQLRLTYGRNDLTPEKLLDEITRREVALGNQPGPKAPGKKGETGKAATPNTLPPPDFGDAKPGVQPKTDPKSLVRQARELLNKERFDEAERLINLAADAKYKWGLFDRDTPDHLRSDLIKMRTRREREEAALCLREGRKKLKEGSLEEAKKLAFDAQRLHGPYTVMDGIGDRPQALLADISKAEQRLGKSKNNPTDPFAETNSDRVKGQLVSRTVENEKKARALALMIEARDLQAKNLLPEARAKAVAASKIQAAFTANEDNPELLLSLLTAQCGNALNTLLQQALDQTNSPDPGRFEKSLQMLGYARQLCMAFELDPSPIDQRADQVRQMQGTASKTDKVVSPQQIQGLELLDQARLELKNGNTPGARRLAEKAFDKRYGVQEEAAQVLRSIDNAEFDRVVKNANRDAQTGIAAFYAKDYRRAAALFANIDLRLLNAELNGRVRELLSSPELQRENLANAPPAKGNFATEKDPQKPAKITVTDDPFIESVAMQKILAEKLRGESTRVLKNASLIVRTDKQQALDILRQFRDELDHSQTDPTLIASVRGTIERRMNEYRSLIAQDELVAEQKATAKKGHDENKLNDAKFKLQEDMVQLNKEFQQLYKEGKYIDAAAKCRLGLELDPDSVWATMGLKMSQLQEQLRDWERNKANNEKYFIDSQRNNMADNAADSKRPYRFSTDPADMQRLSNRSGTEKGLPFSSRSPEEQAIEYGLRKPISVSFKNTELKDVISSLRQMTGLNIVADKQAMDELGIGLDKRLSLDVDRVQLKSVLNMLLRPINMTYVIRDEVLQFTTELNSQGNCIKKVYPVADLVVPIMNNPTVTTNSFQDSMMRHILGQSGYTAPGMGISTPVIPNAGLPPGQPVSNPIGGLGHAVGTGNYGPLSGPDAAQATLADQLIKLIQNIVAPNSWDAVGGQAKIHFFPLGMALAISQTEDAHNEIIGLLAQLRKTQEVQVAIEMRIISVSESFFEAVQVNFSVSASGGKVTGSATNSITGINNFTFGQNPAGTVPQSSSSSLANAASAFALPAFAGLPGALGVGGGLQMGLAFLNDVQVYMFMEAVRTDKRTQVMQAPKVTVVNATTANISINDQIFFTTGANLVQAGAQVFFMPQNNPFPVGVNLQVMPIVSADRRNVRLHLAPTLTNLVSNEIPTVPVQIPVPQFGPGGVPVASAIATMYFQQPRFSTISLTTTVNVPDGGTVLLGGLKTLAEARNESGPPVLADLPFINRLFRNTSTSRDSQSMMIMVTPRIIINEEEEQLFMGQMPPAVSRGY